MGSTTIRVRIEDKKRLERLARKLGKQTLTDTLRTAIDAAEKEADLIQGDVFTKLHALGKGKDVGETDASRIDEYIYGGTS